MKYIIINVILLIAICIIIFIKKDNNKINDKIIDKHYRKILFLLFFLMVITSIYKLGKVPNGIHVDEAGMFYDAKLLAKYGYDRYLNKYPVYLINFGGGQSAMYAYLEAILIKIFGNKLILMRIPAIIFRIVSFISACFLIKNEKDKLKRIIFILLLTITPYFIMQSRIGLDCNLLVNFMIISVSLFVNSIIKNNNKLLFISGIFFGLTLYTYALSYLILPLLLLLTIIYLLYINKINIKKIIILGIPILIFAIPLVLMILVNNGIIKEIHFIITIPKLQIYRGSEISLKNILPNIRIFFAILTFDRVYSGDNLIYNSIPYFGTIYYISIPFFVLGIFNCIEKAIKDIRSKKMSIEIIMIIWFISVISCMLLIEYPNINKANAVFLPLIYFVTVGILSICNNKKCLKYIVIIYLCNYLVFLQYYYFEYNKHEGPAHCVATNYLNALDYAKNSNKKNIYIDQKITNEPYIYIYMNNDIGALKYNKNIIETDEKIYLIGTVGRINDNALYITKDKKNYINYKEFGDIYVIYK